MGALRDHLLKDLAETEANKQKKIPLDPSKQASK